MKKTACILLLISIMAVSTVLLWKCNTPKGSSVVLIVSDALRKDILGCYGGPAKTPNIDWLAKNGVLFKNAYVTAPWTTPSAVSLFTGNYPTSYISKAIPEKNWNIPLVPDDEILPAELLGQAGYDVKMDIETDVVLGQNTMQGFAKIKKFAELTSNEKMTVERITSIDGDIGCYKQMYGFLNYLLSEAKGRFFVLKWIFDPHSPYNPPARFKQEIKLDLSQLPKEEKFYSELLLVGGEFSSLEQRYLKELYTKEVESVDQRLGYILNVLKYRDLLDDTYIIFTSDHGELFGEHGWWCHGHHFYEELVNVPLIIAGPGIPKGKRMNNIVSHIDLMPTVLDLLDGKFQYKSQGKSFKNLLSWNPFKHFIFTINNNNLAYFTYANFWGRHQDALRENDYKLMCGLDGSYELYNLTDDPNELIDIANKNPALVNKMISRLNDIMDKNKMMRQRRTKAEENIPINKELIDQLKALGYID